MWQTELFKLVSDCAPVLGAALAGPTGNLVGQLISHTFGKLENQELIDKIKSDPDAQIKLKQIQDDHESDLRRISFQQSAVDALRAIVEMD